MTDPKVLQERRDAKVQEWYNATRRFIEKNKISVDTPVVAEIFAAYARFDQQEADAVRRTRP